MKVLALAAVVFLCHMVGAKTLQDAAADCAEIKEALGNNRPKFIQCVLNWTNGCDPRIKQTAELGVDIFENKGRCPKVCTPYQSAIVDCFVTELRTKYNADYRVVYNHFIAQRS